MAVITQQVLHVVFSQYGTVTAIKIKKHVFSQVRERVCVRAT